MGIFSNDIAAGDKETLRAYFESFDYQCSGASFSSLYMWRNINRFSWEIIGEYLCIEGLSHLELETGEEIHFMMPPMTRDGQYDEEALARTMQKAKERFELAGIRFTVRLVPEHMLEMIAQACPYLTFEEDRANFDYVYRTDALVEYRGRKLHSKRNHLNYFQKTYQWECVDLRPEMTDDVMAFIRNFNRHKDIPPEEMTFLLMEEAAMEDVFLNMDALGVEGCAILIDGRIEALAAGGWLSENTIVEHIEKANVNFRGLYQLVLSAFCQKVKDRAVYINREEDMNLDNLRTMKLSYHPDILLRKYIGEMKE